MKFTFYVFCSLFLAVLLMSCREEARTKNPEVVVVDPLKEIESEIPAIDTAGIIEELQGKWKEIEYPYRLAHFNNTTVKFTEEGVVEEPTFGPFRIAEDCPFEVNNIKNATSGDVFLVMVEAGTCEIVKVSGDTLTFRGFSTNTNSDYQINYSRVE